MNQQHTHTNDKHYTVREMFELYGVSRSKLDRLAREGKIKKTKFGSSTLFSAQEVQRYLASVNQ
ncbi:TPA: helix-turn-helix domain-containing protein [Pasteurella multocida]|uniref:DNA binding protein n=1 Tax=Pasteurella multocida TaxID=747 RepID=A0A2Z4Q0J4_PASMD|nr:helix-turn-helix domain-containing protein [Pasteurella multocida]EGP02981.1 excisionase family DNA binding domain-containing protein [Pasteurella multocida subsp. multocida str. Anand1_goat]AWY03350.1 DNA binding protein [Pasteurella multocida]MEB3453686.1 helix-turn-helix domain-containing protein [Pasteurella multocida]MEB3455835.1 helix-turn-helix domain-containing protein [Pasteurella multocida]MEB4585187.1 helix-turn-helix domain-containing protein [Pasteurella multocida]